MHLFHSRNYCDSLYNDVLADFSISKHSHKTGAPLRPDLMEATGKLDFNSSARFWVLSEKRREKHTSTIVSSQKESDVSCGVRIRTVYFQGREICLLRATSFQATTNTART